LITAADVAGVSTAGWVVVGASGEGTVSGSDITLSF
jgi:hypothetical protein